MVHFDRIFAVHPHRQNTPQHPPDKFSIIQPRIFFQRFIQPLKRLTIGGIADYRTRNFSVAGHFHNFKGRSRSGLAHSFAIRSRRWDHPREARQKDPGAAGQFFQCRSNGYFCQGCVQVCKRLTIGGIADSHWRLFMLTGHNSFNSLSIFFKVSGRMPPVCSGKNSSRTSGRFSHSRNSFSFCDWLLARCQSSPFAVQLQPGCRMFPRRSMAQSCTNERKISQRRAPSAPDNFSRAASRYCGASQSATASVMNGLRRASNQPRPPSSRAERTMFRILELDGGLASGDSSVVISVLDIGVEIPAV